MNEEIFNFLISFLKNLAEKNWNLGQLSEKEYIESKKGGINE